MLNKDSLSRKKIFKQFNHPVVYATLCQYLKDTTGESIESVKTSIQAKFKETHRQSLVTGISCILNF